MNKKNVLIHFDWMFNDNLKDGDFFQILNDLLMIS